MPFARPRWASPSLNSARPSSAKSARETVERLQGAEAEEPEQLVARREAARRGVELEAADPGELRGLRQNLLLTGQLDGLAAQRLAIGMVADLPEHQAGEVLQALDLLAPEVARNPVADTERAETDAGLEGERDARIEAQAGIADDERVVEKAWISREIGDDQRVVAADRVVAEGILARHADVVEPVMRLDVRARLVEHRDEGHRHRQQPARKRAQPLHQRIDRCLDKGQLGQLAEAFGVIRAIIHGIDSRRNQREQLLAAKGVERRNPIG